MELEIYRPTMTGNCTYIGHPAVLTLAQAHTGGHRPNILADSAESAEEIYRAHLAGTTKTVRIELFSGSTAVLVEA